MALNSIEYRAKLNSADSATQMQRCIMHLYDAANILSPNISTQTAFANLVRTMHSNGETPSSIVCALLCAMLDGIAVGNWPDNNGL